MIEFVLHNEIDKKKWDECINNSINTLIYPNSWYLDIVCPNWNALVIDDYKAVFPLPTRSKLGIKYIFPPYFVQQLGLYFTDEKYNNDLFFKSCLENIPTDYKFIELNINEKNKLIKFSSQLQIKQGKTYLLDLNNSHDQIFKNYTKGLKGKIRKAGNDGVQVVDSEQPEILIKLFKENTGETINKYNEDEYLMLKELIQVCKDKNYAEIKLAYLHNDLIAGAVFLHFHNRITYLLSASSTEGKKYAAMPLILDQVIKKYSGKPFIFDFEGSMVESIARFFKSFGSTESLYLHLKINRLPKLVRWVKD